jgi:hypothetical protein
LTSCAETLACRLVPCGRGASCDAARVISSVCPRRCAALAQRAADEGGGRLPGPRQQARGRVLLLLAGRSVYSGSPARPRHRRDRCVCVFASVRSLSYLSYLSRVLFSLSRFLFFLGVFVRVCTCVCAGGRVLRACGFRLTCFYHVCPRSSTGEWFFDRKCLINYLLLCCQDPRGGLLDKPGKCVPRSAPLRLYRALTSPPCSRCFSRLPRCFVVVAASLRGCVSVLCFVVLLLQSSLHRCVPYVYCCCCCCRWASGRVFTHGVCVCATPRTALQEP